MIVVFPLPTVALYMLGFPHSSGKNLFDRVIPLSFRMSSANTSEGTVTSLRRFLSGFISHNFGVGVGHLTPRGYLIGEFRITGLPPSRRSSTLAHSETIRPRWLGSYCDPSWVILLVRACP